MKSSLLFLCLFIALNVFSDRSIIWHSSFFLSFQNIYVLILKHLCFVFKTLVF